MLNVKEYFKLKPEGFADKDVYVCESRYSTKARMFKKVKVWTSLPTPGVKLVARDDPLEPKRVVSVFRDRIEKHKEELAELGEVEKLPEREFANVSVPLTAVEGSVAPTVATPGSTPRWRTAAHCNSESKVKNLQHAENQSLTAIEERFAI